MSQLGRFAVHSRFGDIDRGTRSSAAVPQWHYADLHKFEDDS